MRYQARITMISRSWSMNVKPVPHANSNLVPRVFVWSREAKEHGNNVAHRAVNTQFSFYDLSIRVEAITLPKFPALVFHQSEWGKRPKRQRWIYPYQPVSYHTVEILAFHFLFDTVPLLLRKQKKKKKKKKKKPFHTIRKSRIEMLLWLPDNTNYCDTKVFAQVTLYLNEKKSLKKGCTKCCWN